VISTRDELHQIIDRLPEADLEEAKRALEKLTRRSSLATLLTNAEIEDEDISPEEDAAVAEAWADVAAGRVVSDKDVRHELGLDD
jgi:hypothetical protein